MVAQSLVMTGSREASDREPTTLNCVCVGGGGMHRNGEQPSGRAHSPKSLPLQSPFTVAPWLGHLPLQHKLQVNVWADNSTRQVKRTGRSEEEVLCHRSGTHMNSGSLSSDSEEIHVWPPMQ